MTTRTSEIRSFSFPGRAVVALLGAMAMGALFAPGCGSKVTAGNEPPEWTECQSPEDCTVIEIGCCDHCNGGELFAVNEAHADEALAVLKETGCSGACTEIACGDGTPTCEGGSCGFVLGEP